MWLFVIIAVSVPIFRFHASLMWEAEVGDSDDDFAAAFGNANVRASATAVRAEASNENKMPSRTNRTKAQHKLMMCNAREAKGQKRKLADDARHVEEVLAIAKASRNKVLNSRLSKLAGSDSDQSRKKQRSVIRDAIAASEANQRILVDKKQTHNKQNTKNKKENKQQQQQQQQQQQHNKQRRQTNKQQKTEETR